MNTKILATAALILTLTGCATNSVQLYKNDEAAIAQCRAANMSSRLILNTATVRGVECVSK